MDKNINTAEILLSTVGSLENEFAFVLQYFSDFGIHFNEKLQSIDQRLNELTPDEYDDLGISQEQLLQNFEQFLQQKFSGQKEDNPIQSIRILGGHNKSGEAENADIYLSKGSITSIVGPTGSGKSRLLADIEWMAQNDTPTGRTILINDELPDISLRFSLEHKLVAQLSQNMNFVMDASVQEFLIMHAESRNVKNATSMVDKIILQANELAGESFTGETPLTSLSGGQSRALMIADTALLSTSPVVLIDEIENAGIDRKKALQLLVRNEKIILMATHDPILALMAEQRLVIKNGGIHKLLITSKAEKNNLKQLETLDAQIMELRQKLRSGEEINST
ncbi:MAG: ATP-binding cassette domain-containing protein [Paludibacter sp.]|nr:ATP-binding cassette domain-containing protein [Paludibacter sp.]